MMKATQAWCAALVGGLGKLAAIMWKAFHSVGPKTRGSVVEKGMSFVAHAPEGSARVPLPEGSVQHPSIHWRTVTSVDPLPVQSSAGGEAKLGVKSKPVATSS